MQDRRRAIGLLEETRKDFLHALDGISDSQWRQSPSPEAWSPAQIAEHIVLSERTVLERLREALEGEPDPDWEKTLGRGEALIRLLPRRNRKAQAPPKLRPKGDWGLREAIERFQATRAGSLALARREDIHLRRYTRRHPFPAIGRLNGYQWLLFIAQHHRRHLLQLEEALETPAGGTG